MTADCTPEDPSSDSLRPVAENALGLTTLKAERVQLALREFPAWSLTHDGRCLVNRTRFPDPGLAFSFTAFAFTAGRLREHFPELRLVGAELEIVVWTPEAGGVTEQDLAYVRALGLSAEKAS